MDTILVTGAAGFIGKSLVRSLLKDQKRQLVCLDIFSMPEVLTEYSKNIIWYNFSFLQFQKQPSLLIDIIKKHNINIAYHLATTLFPKDAELNIVQNCNENVLASVNLFELLYQNGCSRIIYASSAGTIYGINQDRVPFTEDAPLSPMNSYAASKVSCEFYLKVLARKYNKRAFIARISNPYGEEQKNNGTQGVIPIFLNNILHAKEIAIFGSLDATRDYIYIYDLCDALVKLSDYNGNEMIFNIASGSSISLSELIQIIEELIKKEANLKMIAQEYNRTDNVVLSIQRSINELDWTPKISLKEGILKVLKYKKI